MDYQRFIWQETAPGRYEREIDEAEQFYASIAKIWEGIGHKVFTITACVSLSVVPPVDMDASDLSDKIDDSLLTAWKKVRFSHPTLAAPVVYDASTKKCKKVYQSPTTEAELDNWMRDTFEIIDNGQTGQEFANTDPPVGPVAKLYVVKAAQKHDHLNELRRDIVFRSPHDIIDGIGSLYLLHNFLLHASSAFSSSDSPHTYKFTTGNESRNLSPPFRLAANIPQFPSLSQQSKLESTRSLNASLSSTSNVTVLSLPYAIHSSTPGNSKRAAILLTTAQTRSIISACKERGITPTQAIHSSIALALAELQPTNEASQLGRYTSYSIINLRKNCEAPYDSTQHAVSVYHSASALRLVIDVKLPLETAIAGLVKAAEQEDRDKDFEVAVKQVKSFSENTRVDADYLSIVPSLFSSVTPPYPSNPLSSLPPLNNKPSVSLSSLGIVDHIIDSQYHPFDVIYSPWVVGGEYSTGYGIFLGTWNGRIGLSAAYNESFHDPEEARSFLERLAKITLTGLGVKEQ